MPRSFSRFFFAVFFQILPLCICVPNFNSVSLVVLQIRQGVRQNFLGSRDLGHAPFLDFSLWVFEILPLRTCVPNFKYLALLVLEVHQGVRQNLWGHVTQATPLFLDFSLRFLRYCPCAYVCQISSLQLYSFWRYVRVYAKIFLGSRDLGHAPFLDFSSRVFQILSLRICIPNFKSIPLLVLDMLTRANCIGLPIHCNYQLAHYTGFCRISRSILNRFQPNLQAQQCAKKHVFVNFLSFLAQAVSEHRRRDFFLVTLCVPRCSESLDYLA